MTIEKTTSPFSVRYVKLNLREDQFSAGKPSEEKCQEKIQLQMLFAIWIGRMEPIILAWHL